MDNQSKASEGQQGQAQEGQQKGSEGQQQQGQAGESKTEQLLSDISKKLDKGQQASVADQQLLAALLAEGDDDESRKAAQNKGSEFRDLDFKDMDNAQLADAIMKKVSEGMEAMRNDLGKDLKGTRQSSVDFQIKQEVKDARDEFGEDFDKNWKATIQVAERYPRLSVQDAYLLATASGSRGDLLKLQKIKAEEDNKAAGAGLGIDSIDMDALTEEVKGKSTQDTAREIAKRIGL